MFRKLKDQEFTRADIKITQIREVIKDGNHTSYKDILFCAKIKKGLWTTSFCETTLNKLMKKIKEDV